ncbi:MAG: LamG domain-containing protein [Thermosynechococcaceae cyanobacterium]
MLLQPLSTSASTSDKPQSKIWFYAGYWWAVLPNSSGTFLWKLQGKVWNKLLFLSSRTDTRADTKLIGNITHILLYQGQQSQLISIEYIAGSYQIWPGRPTPVNLTLGMGNTVETATIDVDSLGRMWLAYEANNAINVQWSDSPYAIWQGPIQLATGVNSDDICVVTALPTGNVGVLWSNQNTKRFGFRLRHDLDIPTNWLADEVPASQSAQQIGNGMADDHMNVAVASDGTLYAAVKTEYNTVGFTTIGLLIRRPSGTWDNLYEVDQVGTRPIVLLNEGEQNLLVAYTTNVHLNPIVYKKSRLSPISFSSRSTLLANPLNDVTSLKANYTDEVVLLASDTTTAQGALISSTFPIGWWLMNEGSGNTLTDASDNGNDGAINGNPTWATGIKGLALRLDGSGDYARVTHSTSLNIIGNNITLSAWIKPEKIATQRIIDKISGTTGYSMFLSGFGYTSIRFNGNNLYRVNSSALYPTNGTTWMHIAATYNGSIIRIYINGVENASNSVVFNIAGNSSDLFIGADSAGLNSFQGVLDNVRVYNYALSSNEIKVLATMS